MKTYQDYELQGKQRSVISKTHHSITDAYRDKSVGTDELKECTDSY